MKDFIITSSVLLTCTCEAASIVDLVSPVVEGASRAGVLVRFLCASQTIVARWAGESGVVGCGIRAVVTCRKNGILKTPNT